MSFKGCIDSLVIGLVENNLDPCRHVYGRLFSSFVPKTCL
jgi:hypothetical protein